MLEIKRKFSIHKKYSACHIPHYKKFNIIYQDWNSKLSRSNQWDDTRLECKIEMIKSKKKKKIKNCVSILVHWSLKIFIHGCAIFLGSQRTFQKSILIIINIFKEIENNFTPGRKLLAISCCCIQSSGEQNIKLKIFFQVIHFTFARG